MVGRQDGKLRKRFARKTPMKHFILEQFKQDTMNEKLIEVLF